MKALTFISSCAFASATSSRIEALTASLRAFISSVYEDRDIASSERALPGCPPVCIFCEPEPKKDMLTILAFDDLRGGELLMYRLTR